MSLEKKGGIVVVSIALASVCALTPYYCNNLNSQPVKECVTEYDKLYQHRMPGKTRADVSKVCNQYR
jgi:hypothetical protein